MHVTFTSTFTQQHQYNSHVHVTCVYTPMPAFSHMEMYFSLFKRHQFQTVTTVSTRSILTYKHWPFLRPCSMLPHTSNGYRRKNKMALDIKFCCRVEGNKEGNKQTISPVTSNNIANQIAMLGSSDLSNTKREHIMDTATQLEISTGRIIPLD